MSLRQSLQTEPITHFDLSHYCEVASGATLRQVIQTLRDCQHNCAFVLKEGRLVGIFTDRDILRKVVHRPEIWDEAVDAYMTTTLMVLSAGASAAEALALMHKHHFRNVPVVNAEGGVVGNLTHYSLLELLAASFPEEVYNRPPDDSISNRRHGA